MNARIFEGFANRIVASPETFVIIERENDFLGYIVTGPMTDLFHTFPKNEMNLAEFINQNFNGFSNVQEANIIPGVYFPHIFKPGPINQISFTEESFLKQSKVQLDLLIKMLLKIFETIEPHVNNLSTFGHEIRNVLLLGCMNVEANWKKILTENGYPNSSYLKTTDYVKLKEPLRLDSYKVKFRWYPDLPEFSPFNGWIPNPATGSLPWYSNYNSTKHDVHNNLDKATLESAINSIISSIILTTAQAGSQEGTSLLTKHNFEIIAPRWDPEHRYYSIPASNGSNNQTISKTNYNF